MALPEDFAEPLAELEEYIGRDFIWNGSTYTATAITGERKGGNLEPYGWAVDRRLTIIVLTDRFNQEPPTGPPLDGQAITYRGKIYRIDSVEPTELGGFLRLVCVDASRGS